MTRVNKQLKNTSGLFIKLQNTGPLLALIILLIVLSITSEYFFSVNNFLNIIRQFSINLIISLGMTVVIISGGIDLSVGSVLSVSACSMALAVTKLGFPTLLAIILGIVIAILLGTINGFLISRTKIPDFIMTLGMLSAAKGIALVITNGRPISNLPKLLVFFGSARLFGYIPISGIIAIVMSILTWFILNYTTLGRAAYAIGGNKEAARAAGLDVANYTVKYYALSGFFVSIAALILIGRINSANPLMGNGQELSAIAATIIGGTSFSGGEGKVSGTIIGALIMGVISNGLNLLNVSSFWQDFFIGSLIIIVVVVDRIRRKDK